MKKVLLALTLSLSVFASQAAEGFKVGADGTKFFTYWGGVAVYQDEQKITRCKFNDKVKSVDNYGDAYIANGFICSKHLYIVIKEYVDVDSGFLVVFDPDRWEERKVYQTEMFIRYREYPDENPKLLSPK